MLSEFVGSTGYNRVYAARLLRGYGARVRIRGGVVFEGSVGVGRKREGKREYGQEVARVLVQVWEMMDYICGNRLKAVLPEVVDRLVELGELRVEAGVREKLIRISASTIDRLLKPERPKYQLKSRSRTKPGTLLKHQIPVRTFSQWDDTRAGFLEVDLVGHDGGSSPGEYCQTLDATDVATGWSEQVAVRTVLHPNFGPIIMRGFLHRHKVRLPRAGRSVGGERGAQHGRQTLRAAGSQASCGVGSCCSDPASR